MNLWALLGNINGAVVLAVVALLGITYVVWCCLRVGAAAERDWDAMSEARRLFTDDEGRRGL